MFATPSQKPKKKKNKKKNKKKTKQVQGATLVLAPSQGSNARRAAGGGRLLLDNLGDIIPRNEQDTMLRTVTSVKDSLTSRYIAALINPKMNLSRVPDSFIRPTAIVRSITTLNIPIRMVYPNPEDATNGGRFSIAIQPTLGSTATPSQYKVAVVHPNTTWEHADWTDINNYLQVVQGTDVRLDQLYLTLTQPPVGSYLEEGFDSNDTNSFFRSGQVELVTNYNTIGIVDRLVAGQDSWRVPFGQFIVTVTAFDDVAVIQGGPTLSGGTVDQVADTVAYNSTDGTMAAAIYYITVNADGAVFTLNWRHTGVLNNTAFISFTPTYYSSATLFSGSIAVSPAAVPSENYGIIQSYRTIAMSCLATYTGPLLTNGGNIAAAYVPGGTVLTNFFTSNPQSAQGAFQDWEYLAKVPGSYNGEIDKGCYVFWTPEDNLDMEFRRPNEATLPDDPPPCLIVSGKYNPSQALTTDQTVIRLEINTQYEIESTFQLFDLETCVGSQAIIDAANAALAHQPHAMANAAHTQWLKDFWGGLKKGIGYFEQPAKFLWNNRDKIAPLLV